MNNIIYEVHLLSKEDIDKRFRQIIKELYCCCYTKDLIIEKLYPIGYKISIPLLNDERPFVVAIEAEGEDFFKYLKRSLQESALTSAKFFTVSDSLECPDAVYNIIKGNYSNTHRVLQDNITYIVENINS